MIPLSCPNCRAEIPDGAAFCPTCGRPTVGNSDYLSYPPHQMQYPPPPPPPPPQYQTQYPPPPYPPPPPQYQMQYPPATVMVSGPGTNGLAIAALVLGIVWIWGLGSLLALIFGLISKKQINQSNGAVRGRGLAISGIVLGIVGILGAIALIIILIIAAQHSPACNPYDSFCSSDS